MSKVSRDQEGEDKAWLWSDFLESGPVNQKVTISLVGFARRTDSGRSVMLPSWQYPAPVIRRWCPHCGQQQTMEDGRVHRIPELDHRQVIDSGGRVTQPIALEFFCRNCLAQVKYMAAFVTFVRRNGPPGQSPAEIYATKFGEYPTVAAELSSLLKNSVRGSTAKSVTDSVG